MTRFRMTCAVMTAVLAGLGVYATVEAQQSQEKTSVSKVRVGTFDSRALAFSYFGSEEFNHKLNDLRSELEKEKAAGNEKRTQELDAELLALGELMHKQGFSTWPVDDILDKIKGEIPEIATLSDVAVIVSKWDVVYQRAGVEFVDVTDLMVRLFDPNEDTLTGVKEIQEQEPVPLEN